MLQPSARHQSVTFLHCSKCLPWETGTLCYSVSESDLYLVRVSGIQDLLNRKTPFSHCDPVH